MSKIEALLEINRAKMEILKISSDIKFRKLMRAIKANFDPNQPRDEIGQWTDGGDSVETRYSLTVDAGEFGGEGEFQLAGSTVTIEYGAALTGIQSIDETTVALSDTLGRAMQMMDFIPTWTPRVYGTAVHVAFGAQVRLMGWPGIAYSDVEQSFRSDGYLGDYGEPGTIRTDVLLRNAAGSIIAIYDVKTGNAGLSASRIRQIRSYTNTTSSVPIIELNVLRGASIKSHTDRAIGTVIARLENPAHHRGNRDRPGGG